VGSCAQVIWSVEVKSPDGEKVAAGKTFDNTGPGTDGPSVTVVYLNYKYQKPKEILAFVNNSYPAADAAVDIKWLSSTRLEVTYHKDKQEVDFQAIKLGDVEITLKTI
jgi:hypothetical protein